MRYSKLVICFVLLFTVPSLALYPQTDILATIIEMEKEALSEPLQYDHILHLMHHLEHGELEQKCNQAELEKIHHLLISLARREIFFDEVAEELALETEKNILVNMLFPSTIVERKSSFKSHSNKKRVA